jgi:hypothetical protein
MMVRFAFTPLPHVPALNSLGGELDTAFCLTRVCWFLHSVRSTRGIRDAFVLVGDGDLGW